MADCACTALPSGTCHPICSREHALPGACPTSTRCEPRSHKPTARLSVRVCSSPLDLGNGPDARRRLPPGLQGLRRQPAHRQAERGVGQVQGRELPVSLPSGPGRAWPAADARAVLCPPAFKPVCWLATAASCLGMQGACGQRSGRHAAGAVVHADQPRVPVSRLHPQLDGLRAELLGLILLRL